MLGGVAWIPMGRATPLHFNNIHQFTPALSAPGSTRMNWRERFTSDPNICHGRLCVKASRVMVSVILDNLAA